MKTELVLFGKPINMASRSRRRCLVAVIYSGIGGLIGTLCFIGHWDEVGALAALAAGFANLFIGGYGYDPDGMVKPFRGNEALVRLAQKPRSLWSYLFFPWNIEEREYRNDEREVSQRDHAHYRAYRYLGIVVSLAFLIAYIQHWPSLTRWTHLHSASANELIFVLLIVGVVFFETLPQAILLWTEPDMEEPQP